MKTIIIYHSQTGFTKRYAEWIAEEVHAECVPFEQIKKYSLEDYDTIVFGGWACAGGISKLAWFKSNMSKWDGKKLVAFCVGGSPMENPEVEQALNHNFNEEEQKKVRVFYCPGGMNYEKMSSGSKLLMKMFVASLKAKKNPREEDKIMIKMISASYDISDKKYIEPIITYIK